MVAKLRFGVMCTGERVESASAAAIDELLRIDAVELALIIVDATPPVRGSLRDALRRIFSLRGNLWALFQRQRPLRQLSCRAPRDMSAAFVGIPRIHCRVTRKEEVSQYFQPEDVKRIQSYRLDFILRFAFGVIRGDILTSARYGIWSFHHGDGMKFRGGPAAFWEVFHVEPTTGAILLRLVDGLDAGIILQECHIETHRCSYAANLNAIMWAAVHMPARVCRDILSGSARYLEAAPSRTRAPLFRTPTDLQMVRFLSKIWTAWVAQQVEGLLFRVDWNVGIVHAPVHSFLQPGVRPDIRWLVDGRKNSFCADPFTESIGPGRILSSEWFDYTSNRGWIVEMDLDASGVVTSPPRRAIDNGLHMSYPYLFEHKGQVYCAPENWQGRRICLYAWDCQRRQWRVAASIIEDFPALDPTLVQHEGLWWLWCTHAEDEPNSKLFLWHAPDLLGPWTPHPANPVKVDIRSSRPAGRPFHFAGNLYRPAQDCSRTYGGAITINCITRLSITEFSEEPAAHIEPWDHRYPAGIHTLAGDGSLTVLDGMRLVLDPSRIPGRLAHKIRRLIQTCRHPQG